jgi:dipeptidyl aminopeptidase/acylaminoacyl peptidase
VDLVGISNLVTWFNNIPPYWAPLKPLRARRVGDPEKDAEFLQSRSPLFFVERIRMPLLIGQGANDPRVVQAESDQIVAALRQANKPMEYIVYTDEGHGLVRPENRLHFYAIAEAFLATYLGGRVEPTGEIKGHAGVRK